MHVERFGNDEVQGIELGSSYVFPKIDGTNGSVWWSGNKIQAGSRNRHLTEEKDNAGFFQAVKEMPHVIKFCEDHPNLTLYGEWLVPHSIKYYRDDAWRQFYVFDVYDREAEKYLHYDQYSAMLEADGIEYLRPMTIIKNATYENFLALLNQNTFLCQEAKGIGEGVVIKNYDFINRFGNQIWAKIVTNSFKEQHTKAMGPSIKDGKKMVEQFIVDEYVTSEFINKVYAKIVNEENGWRSQYIPRLLNTVYYDLVNEEIWNIVKKTKNPTINFKTLSTLVTLTVKATKPELF